MIREIVTAAAMYFSDQALVTAADTLIPETRPQQQCRHRDLQKMKSCLELKLQPQPDPYAAMWDADWVSAVTPIVEDGVAAASANSAKPDVAKKPHK